MGRGRRSSNTSIKSNTSTSSGSSVTNRNTLQNGLVSPVDSEHTELSWNKLTADIVMAIHLLNQSTRRGSKEKFIPQSSAIVECIRTMLFASGTAKKDAPLIASHKMLKMHHRNIMSSLSRLVLSAKLASGVWPPPDSAQKMQQCSNDVLLAVRHFVAAAQDVGVELKYSDEFDQKRRNSGQDEDSQTQTNSELIAQLERYNRGIVKIIDELVSGVRSMETNSSSLITQVRSLVTEVGNFLALVDELLIESLSDELTVDFKVNRLASYNAISGLVMATQTATNPLAPTNAVEQVINSTTLVDKTVTDLLISTKFLVEEKDQLEQMTLQSYIEQYDNRQAAEISVRPRRAMSLSMLVQNNDETSSGSPRESSELTRERSSSNQLLPTTSSSVVNSEISKARPTTSSTTSTTSTAASTITHTNKTIDSRPWFLSHDYSSNELVLNMEGRVKGGTIPALIERLTMHDSIDSSFTMAFLITYRSFLSSLSFIKALIQRFELPSPEGLQPRELDIWIEKKQNPIRLRCALTKTYYYFLSVPLFV